MNTPAHLRAIAAALVERAADLEDMADRIDIILLGTGKAPADAPIEIPADLPRYHDGSKTGPLRFHPMPPPLVITPTPRPGDFLGFTTTPPPPDHTTTA